MSKRTERTKRQLAQAKYYRTHKRALRAKARKRSRQRPVSYRICRHCRKKIKNWGVNWTLKGRKRQFRGWLTVFKTVPKGFYHRPCLVKALELAVRCSIPKGVTRVMVKKPGRKKAYMTKTTYATYVIESFKGQEGFSQILPSFRVLSF